MSATMSAPPDALSVTVAGIPPDLASRPQWVTWRFTYRPDADKPWTKEPINPATGALASSTDPQTWGTLAQALDYAARHNLPGVGYVFAPDDPFAGVDLDACRDPNTHELTPRAVATVTALDSYTELSPSGTGLHIIVAGTLPPGRRREGPVEMYDRGRYFTITGHRLPGTPETVQPRQTQLDRFHAAMFGTNGHKTYEEAAARGSRTPELSDADVIARARDAANGHRFDALFNGDTNGHGGDDSAADLALLSHLAFWTQDESQLDRLFRRSGLYREKWERADYRQRTVTKALERTETYSPGGPRVTVNGTGAAVSPAPDVEWPMLDPAALSGLPGEIVRAFDPHTEADPVATLATVIVMFGSCVGRTPHMMVGDDRHGANLFAVLVGDTAKARKGSSQAGPRRLFGLADPDWESQRVQGGLSSGEGLVWAIRDPIHRVNRKGEDEIIDNGVADKRLLCVEEEFSAVLKVATRQGNTISEQLRRAWDSRPSLRILTKNSPATATNPHIAMLGHVTATELKRTLSETEQANGLANRMMWLCVRRSKALPFMTRLSDQDAGELAHELRASLDQGRKTGEVQLDADARELWANVYPALSDAKPGLVGALVARGEAITLRLALTYARCGRASSIGSDHLFAALALWQYAEDSARYLFGDATGDAVADRILAALRRTGPLSQDDIRELFSRHERAERIGQALELLVRAGLVTMTKHETKGRPVTIWTAR
jgi:hypothetical protein